MIQKRTTKTGDTRWLARWRDPAGKERSKTFDTRREAKAHVAEMERSRHMGTYLDPADKRLTVRELVQKWIGQHTGRPNTIKQYEHFKCINLGWLGDYPARDVTQTDINRWIHDLRTGRPWRGSNDKGLSEKSVSGTARALKTAYAWGADQGMVPAVPMRMPVKDNSRVEPDLIPELSEIQAVIDLVRSGGAPFKQYKGEKGVLGVRKPQPMIADMLTVAMMTGLRLSELRGLVVREIDYEAGVIRVRAQMGQREFGTERVELKTSASRRDVPIADELVPALQRITRDKSPNEHIFVTSSGRVFGTTLAATYVRNAARHLGLEHVHFHALRHYFASALITAGVPIQDVAQVLGHSSPTTTLSVYTHVLEGSRERVAGAISAAVGGGISAGSTTLRSVG